ncbi:MAG TPA: hypothetical protein PLH15_10615 [Spirochaetota bacterium]|nr:hypothetical protein [Spirochaetota bacterium]HQQ24280.1 hypothetical protein [Spirochaetota bacterium]
MAFYYTKDRDQLRQAIKRFKEGALAGRKITLIIHNDEKKGGRSQLNYAHALFQIASMKSGLTFDEIKYDYFKRSCNPDIFIYERANPVTGEIKLSLKSIEDQSVNITVAIERFKNRFAADYGFDLPEPNNKAELERYEYLAQFYQYF